MPFLFSVDPQSSSCRASLARLVSLARLIRKSGRMGDRQGDNVCNNCRAGCVGFVLVDSVRCFDRLKSRQCARDRWTSAYGHSSRSFLMADSWARMVVHDKSISQFFSRLTSLLVLHGQHSYTEAGAVNEFVESRKTRCSPRKP